MSQKNAFFVVPSLRRRDGTGDYLFSQYELLKSRGYRVHLCAQEKHESVSEQVHTFEDLPRMCGADDTIVYHYGIYDRKFDIVAATPCANKVLYYHNQTSPYFFDDYDPETAQALRDGLVQIAGARDVFHRFLANSPYTIAQQRARGVLSDVDWRWAPPMIRDALNLATPPVASVTYDLASIGRIVPHKRLHKALHVFRHYRRMRPGARMAVVGGGAGRYFDDCINLARSIDGVDLHLDASDDLREEVLTSSKMLLNLSAHEGFGVPVFEGVSAGCLPIYGASEWLHEMIFSDPLRVCLDDDYEFAAYTLAQIDDDKRSYLLGKVRDRLAAMSRLFTSEFQFEMLCGVPATRPL
ncbi:MAG: glycosyl transferase family 2 [Hyphomicrobiales bacterium]|nr:glycosyl transferase family 2 [Hyphomicrobiales bacterium]